ncbi:Hypothetical Protein FCC1311_022182 [Hondaea fermentalgiana]|uniref:Uncharacterized protein n=1 Tax=Hondaea fermentalgiana TaxID=2315210 RepID=A0A2R5G884_9STRA|nr:Hypothetical Protein FCC1311_022182 [Hondaea fermentalgiana]|eukprot:GBG25998.1 Hypothetical Protein FCC1311_022182 [Hondaea fermentalgiana]
MKLSVALLVVAGLAAGSEASETFVWVPTEACDSPVKLCYEGPEDEVRRVAQVDPMNPCRKSSEVFRGNCLDQGYERHLGNDPIFDKLDLYIKFGNELAFNEVEARSTVVGHALDSLESLGSYKGVCWRTLHERVKGMHAAPCDATTEDDQLGICYPKCATGGEGVGPICLGGCGGSHPIAVGAICCDTQDSCNRMIQDLGVKLAYDIGKVAMDHASTAALLEDLRKLAIDARGLVLPECKM